MRQFNLLLAFFLSFGLVSCQTPKKAANVAKVKKVQTLPDDQRRVVFESDGAVYGKICEPPFILPLTKDCRSNSEPFAMTAEEYLDTVPLGIGGYSRDEEGLARLNERISRAREGYVNGNPAAHAELERLRPLKVNLERFLKIKGDLLVEGKSLTMRAYPDLFPDLWETFTVRAH